MQSLAYVQYSSSVPGSQLFISGDLRLQQKAPLPHRGRYTVYNVRTYCGPFCICVKILTSLFILSLRLTHTHTLCTHTYTYTQTILITVILYNKTRKLIANTVNPTVLILVIFWPPCSMSQCFQSQTWFGFTLLFWILFLLQVSVVDGSSPFANTYNLVHIIGSSQERNCKLCIVFEV